MAEPSDVTPTLAALRSSVSHLSDLIESLPPDQLERDAYPSEWSIAEVLSHVGSGAVIQGRRIRDALDEVDTPDDFAPGVWDEWNAKTPTAKAADARVADAAFLETVEGIDDDARSTLRVPMGPMSFTFAELVGLRLNEHILHTWDVEVALDPTATVQPDGTALAIDQLDLIAGFTGKPTGDERVVTITTSDPERHFDVVYTPDRVQLVASAPDATADLVLPAEAFIRLVYGRLDPAHTPVDDSRLLDDLRHTFPGP